ncbi:MAG TPA: M14 family zinc carboxypeptidase [Blastocatellia bacterium]|nr:M14 family zinc carboxypeptidase [Blastocatellia bacterium]
MTLKRTVLSALIAFISAANVIAQDKFDFYSRGPYAPAVPRPSSVTGYEPGQFQTPHGQIVRVIEKIAAAAPERVRVIDNGETWERRKLYLVIVSAPENLARLEEIKANLAKLADPRKIKSEDEANQIARSTPVVVWLNYGIHGNESASYETVQQVLYQLAASDEARTLEILKNVVVVINAMHNPDGHERFAVWENSVAIGDAETFSIEHREPFQIYGRGNHYRFDMNRDMLALTQPENHAVLRGVREWRPQVFVDHHGQVASYFFPPAAEPVNKNLPVDKAKFWYDKFGRGNAAAFDRFGWNYYVRHVFDIYYAGYMDSWSSLQGATGMTYETDGGGPRSLEIKRDDETILTFRQGIAKHFTASMATLETAADNRELRLKDYYSFFKTGMDEGRAGPMKRVVLLAGRDPGRAANLVRNLVRQGIEVTVAREGFRSSSAHDYLGSAPAPREFPAGAYVIDLNQPMKRLAKAHLEPASELDQTFIKAELERRARNEARGKNVGKEDPEFYDITSWSLPLAFGVEAYWTEDAPAVNGAQVNEMTIRPAGDAGAQPAHAGVLTAADSRPISGLSGSVEGGRANTAYVIPYGADAASSLALALLGEGFKLAVATRQLNAGGRNWPAGTLIARVHRNPETLHARMAALAASTGAQVYAVNTAFTEEGDTGVGSESVVSLKQPRVAVVWDEGTDPLSYGAMWYSFERTYKLRFTPVTINALKSADLSKFNVIILPDGGGGAYNSALGKDGVEKLKAWANGGGVLVGVGGGATMFANKDVDLTSSRLVGSDDESQPGNAAAEQPAQTPAAVKGPVPSDPGKQKETEKKPKEKRQEAEAAVKPEAQTATKKKPAEPVPVPGAAFRARVNRNHFLSYGYDSDAIIVLMGGDAFFRPSKEGANVVTFNQEGTLAVAGFTWPGNTEELLRGTSYVIDEPRGRGHVILFAADPNFRYLWRTTAQLFLNSILFAPALQ